MGGNGDGRLAKGAESEEQGSECAANPDHVLPDLERPVLCIRFFDGYSAAQFIPHTAFPLVDVFGGRQDIQYEVLRHDRDAIDITKHEVVGMDYRVADLDRDLVLLDVPTPNRAGRALKRGKHRISCKTAEKIKEHQCSVG